MSQHEGLGGEAFDKLPDGLKRHLMGMAANALMSRAQLVDQLLFQGARDIDSDCGYPKNPIGAQFYQDLYDRGEIPGRVVEVFPHECWQVSPSVYEDEDPDKWTPFEETWYDLGQSLRPEQSWHSGEAGSLVWELLHRADIISGIGQYAVILLGLDDNVGLDQPAAMIEPPQPGKVKPERKLATLAEAQRKLLYARVFPETLATITRLEEDQRSPRFGQPAEYEITFADPNGQGANVPLGAAGQTSAPGQVTRLVHWSRVIHVADNRQSNEVYGVPRQQQVLNRLLDLRKIYGGSAEMYWKGAFMGVSLETWPQLGWDVDINEEKTKDMMWRWQNGLQRWIQLTGQTAKPLSPQVVDPSGQINVSIEAICIKLGCPVRIFKGSERGELASSQDDAAWNDRLKLRQHRYLTPRLIVPFVDRLISLRVLPEPEEYLVWWPDLTSKGDGEKAQIAGTRTTAIVAYASSAEARSTMAPLDYWTRIQGYTDEEAQAIVDNAEEEKAKQEAEAAKQQAEADAKAQEDHQKALELAQVSKPAPQPGAPSQGTSPDGTAPDQAANPDTAAVTSPRGAGGPTGNVDWDFEEDVPLTNAKRAALTGGRWVTIEGAHVYLKGGEIVAGPKSLVGEDIKDVKGGERAAEGKKAAAPAAKDTKKESAKDTKKESAKDTKKEADPHTVPEGTFGVAKELKWETPDPAVKSIVEKLLGPKASKEDLASCAGAPDGSLVSVKTFALEGRTYCKLKFRSPPGETPYEGTRTLIKNKDGSLFMRNDGVEGKGVGLHLFGRQVENAVRWGFTHIDTEAAGEGGGVTGQRNPRSPMNGYYTWPRTGYDSVLPAEFMGKMPANLKTAVGNAGGRVSGLMATKEGRDWWLGHGSSIDATFDLKKGSYSRQTFRAYLEERGLLKG